MVMEEAVEVAIEKINEMKLEIEKSLEYKKDYLSEKKLKALSKEREIENERSELVETSHEKHKLVNDAYLYIISFFHRKWLEEENWEYKEIFDKFRPKINLGRYYSLNSLLTRIEELVKLEKQIKTLEKEIYNYENSDDDEQWIEDLKTLSESHLEALGVAEEWHQRDIEAKIEKRLDELGIGSSNKTQCLVEQLSVGSIQEVNSLKFTLEQHEI